ncbi:MAG: CPBP family intramembrane metalloprotease [Planctomycetes bacterium]|nr:CPBP family intramembrane metalloprotease [Planctomycetota bacterium]
MSKKNNIIAVCLTMILPSVFSICYFVFTTEQSFAQILYSTSRFLLVLLPIVWVIFVDKQRFPLIRFKTNGLFAGVLSGFFIGAVILAFYFFVFKNILDFSMLRFKAEQLGFSGNNFFIVAIFITLINSLVEEYYWRWFAFSKLRSVISSRKAMIISALGFSFHHLIVLITYFGMAYGILFSFGTFIGGVVWAYFYDRYDSILPCIVSHIIVDVAVMIVGYDVLFS